MNLNVNIEEFFEKPKEEVWRALVDRAQLAAWLMANDFKPQLNWKFRLTPDHPTPWDGDVQCEVLELSPPRRMVWSWQTRGMESPTTVVFELSAVRGGTRLIFKHVGGAQSSVSEGLERGWPRMISRLKELLVDSS